MLGKPVMMVKGTGMSDIVKTYDIGELIDFSEEGFMTGLQHLLSRKNEWGDMSVRMKNLYEEQFSWEIMQDRLINLYSDL